MGTVTCNGDRGSVSEVIGNCQFRKCGYPCRWVVCREGEGI